MNMCVCVWNLAAGEVKGSVIVDIHQAQVWLGFVQQELWNADKGTKSWNGKWTALM